MKDAILTVRVPAAMRRRLEDLARDEGRSLSGQVERLLHLALAEKTRPAAPPPLSGRFAEYGAPTWEELRAVRRELGRALDPGRQRAHGRRR
jgi:hypothetical protein